MRLRMKMCIKQYHALIPQLYLIAFQWGVSIEDTLAHNDIGLPKLRKTRKRQSNQKGQLHNKAKKPEKQIVKKDTEDTDRARPQQQPLVEVDTPVAGPSAECTQKKV
jgi:hypothetical protein